MYTDKNVKVGGSVGMSVHKLEELAGRSIAWDRVKGRSQALEIVEALGTGAELSKEIELNLVRVFLFV